MACRLPKRLAEAFRLYEREGFTVQSVERATKHWKVKFNEFPETQFLTSNDVDGHALKNNVARFRRLAKKGQSNECQNLEG